MSSYHFVPLDKPTAEIAEAFSRWENDPVLIPLTRPNRTKEDLTKHETITIEELQRRLKHQHIYLIYLDDQLVGEANYTVNAPHLLKKEPNTTWIGISIGEAQARGKGVGRQALTYLEQEIKAQGLPRIELGVFEFNIPAHTLYKKMNYVEFSRVPDFTYWDGKMWQDIRMEKYL